MNEQWDDQDISTADVNEPVIDVHEAAEGVDTDLGTGADVDDARIPSQGALPLDVQTGDSRVDAAVSGLRELDRLPVSEHAEVFTQVHRDLQDALLTLDQG